MTININRNARRGLATLKHFRNGMYPASYPHGFLVEETNRLVSLRTKSIELGCPPSQVPSAGGASRTRWRAMYHSSTHAKYLHARIEAAQVDHGTTDSPYVEVALVSTGGATLATATLNGGTAASGTVDDVPSEFLTNGTSSLFRDSNGDAYEVTPETDYQIIVTDIDNARAIGCAVWEEALEPTEANGYIEPGAAAGAPILDGERAGIVPVLRNAWKRNAASLWVWSSNTDGTAPTRTASTSRNWVDQTFSGAFAAGEPHVTLDLSNRTTVRRGTVPLKWWVNASRATSGTGTVSLVGENAGILAVQNITASTPTWVSTTINAPAASDKFVLLLAGTGTNATRLYASSLLQVEA